MITLESRVKANPDELQSFASVVDSGSISAIAGQVGLTTSAASRTLSCPEHRLDTTLLSCTTRRMELTEEDRCFLDRARQILQQVRALEEHLAPRRWNPTEHLRVNTVSSFMLHTVMPHIDKFRRLYPNIQLKFSTSDLIIGLLEQCTNVAVHVGTLNNSTLHAQPLGASRLHILVGSEYLARHGTPMSIEELRGHTLLGFTQPKHLNRWPVIHADGSHLEIQPSISASNDETLHQPALSHQGIAYLASLMTGHGIQDGRLVSLFAEQMSEHQQPIYAVYYRSSQLVLRVQHFLDFIRRRLGA